MESDDRLEGSAITFADAIEALSNIADMNVESQHDVEFKPHTVVLSSSEHASSTIDVAKNSFRVILKYLQKFYQKESGYLLDPHTVEGIKNIMRLVGEAAKKLDRYSQLLHGARVSSVTDLREYRQLQEFYQRRIAQKIDERVLSGWILNLMQPQPQEGLDERVVKSRAKKRVFIDLESVRKDADYELFFLRKEDGSRYYNPRLLRNLRLVCDFGDYIGDIKNDDPLASVDLWRDRVFHATASSIWKAARSSIDQYLKTAARFKDNELVEWVNKTLTALVLAANPRNLLSKQSLKSCTAYFLDYQTFLRGALSCREYQKLVVYPPKKENRVACALRDVVHSLCQSLYTQSRNYPLLVPVIGQILDQTAGSQRAQRSSSEPWGERFKADYAALAKHLKYHPNRPLRDVLALLEDGGGEEWDPLLQRNVPGRLFNLQLGDSRLAVLRMACPIRQDHIQKAVINEEFKEWLRVDAEDEPHFRDTHLFINLQDSTSWQEHARCKVIEELPKHVPYDKRLTTMTLAVDTDFYHQNGPYHKVSQSDLFIQQLKDHLAGEGSGCYFPRVLRDAFSTHFVDGLLNAIHEIAFTKRNVLSVKERMNFIEIVCLFLILKAIDVVKPDSLSLVCKDGVDAGSAFNALLFGASKVLNQDAESAADCDDLELLFHVAPLLVRERVMPADRFQRAVDALQCLAGARADHGPATFRHLLHAKLGPLYQRPWWQSSASVTKVDAPEWH